MVDVWHVCKLIVAKGFEKLSNKSPNLVTLDVWHVKTKDVVIIKNVFLSAVIGWYSNR